MILSATKINQFNRNILWSVIIKAANISFVILIVRRSIEILGVEGYGIWTAITSIATWISLLDIGIGNGLRKELRLCFINEDWRGAKKLMNTAYLFMGAFSLIVMVVFGVCWYNTDWAAFFNIQHYSLQHINTIVLITFMGLLMQLVFSLILPVLNANMHSGLIGIFPTIANGLLLVYIYIVNSDTVHILQYALLNAFLPVLAYLAFSLYYFMKYLPQLTPDFKETNFKAIGQLMLVSGKFFFIQISAVLMYQMTSFLIIRYFSPNDVTQYNVAFRYFNLFFIGFMTIMSPLWSSTTDAYLRGDLNWITQKIKQYVLIMALVWVGIIVGYFLRAYAFHLWVRDVEISTKICLYVALFTAILSWNNIFLYIINGTGKIHLQFILAIITTLIFFPLTHFLVKYLGFGIDGIFISNVAILLMFSFFMPLQTYFLLKTNRQGIWTR